MESTNETMLHQRGGIWLVNFGAGRPGEPTKNRPAVIISDPLMSRGGIHDLLVVVPLSSSVTRAPARPDVPASPETGLERDSVAMAAGLRGIAPSRLLKRLGHLNDETMNSITRVVAALLRLAF